MSFHFQILRSFYLKRNAKHLTFVFQDQLNCLLVCKLWNEFTSGHVFKRRVERMVDEDESLQVRFSVIYFQETFTSAKNIQEISVSQQWDKSLHVPLDSVSDWTVYKKMLAKIFLLKDMWRHREPKVCTKMLLCMLKSCIWRKHLIFQTKRLFCDSFVLSVKADDEKIYCGLNNGCVQVREVL